MLCRNSKCFIQLIVHKKILKFKSNAVYLKSSIKKYIAELFQKCPLYTLKGYFVDPNP